MSENNPVKIAVIGAGHIAQVVHIPIWKKINHVELIGVCDKVAAKAKWVAERFHIPSHHTDPEFFFKSPEISAIDICTDTGTHKALAIAALAAGKHVIVEKPMAKSYADAKAMAEAASKYNRHLMVAMNVRFRREAIALKSFIDANELGQVYYARSGWLLKRNLASASNSWLYDRNKSGGGVLMDLGIQMLDVAIWLMGETEPVSVKAVTFKNTAGLKVEDSATCFLHFKSGAVLSVEVSWTMMAEKDILYVNLFGTEGTALINPLRVYKNMHGNLINIVPLNEESATLRYKRSYRNELKHFVNCLRQGIPMQAGAAEMVAKHKIVEAIYRSAEEGREVVID